MRIWIDNGVNVRTFEVEDLAEAQELVSSTQMVADWDVYSFRPPPREPEPVEEFKYVQF